MSFYIPGLGECLAEKETVTKFAVVALILSFLLPLLIGIGRYFWHMALISPSVFG